MFFPTPTDNLLRMALPALVLGVLLAVCCYFGNLGNALPCESCYFPLQTIQTRGCSSKRCAPPLSPLGQKLGGRALPPAPPPPGSKAYVIYFNAFDKCKT